MVRMLSQVIHLLCLLAFMGLAHQQVSANEIEQEINSAITTNKYIDFDGNGQFDFDHDADQEETSKLPAFKLILVSSLASAHSIFTYSEDLSSYGLFKDSLYDFSIIVEIFQPPRLS